jgi:glycosyltransferase involved in cell wall biosynthesis
MQKPSYYFFYGCEEHPPVRTSRILRQLNGHYDLIYIGFWQGLLSFDTVSRIYERFKAPVILATVDLSVMTGGCHYPHACTRYKQQCGHCPGLKYSFYDSFTQHNIQYRESFYERIDPVILCNAYVAGIFNDSRLLQGRKLVPVFPVIDEKMFCPKEKNVLRERFGIPPRKEFIMLAGAQSFQEDRKGARYLIAALDDFYEKLSEDDRKRILLLCVGNMKPEMELALRFEVMPMGYVSLDVLADLYAVSDVFLSPSIEDGGPMMVNQALSCGTPVVSFQIGTALEVVEGKGTGYCARLRDAEDFAAGIRKHFLMSPDERAEVSARCRKLALETTSYEACSRSIDKLFEML